MERNLSSVVNAQETATFAICVESWGLDALEMVRGVSVRPRNAP